jgi:hypothetical protein
MDINQLRKDLSVKSKNGLDFTLSAGVIWLLITFIWTTDFSAYNKSVLTFIAGGVMLPLTLLFSKIFKTTWTNRENPLQSLGLWFNFAQLFYFPLLVLALVKYPEDFVLIYAVITGAHLFPYSWFYKNPYYAVFAGLMSVGAIMISLLLSEEMAYVTPLFLSIMMFILTSFLFLDYRKKISAR